MDIILSIVIALSILVSCILTTIELWYRREIHKLMLRREEIETQKKTTSWSHENIKLHHNDSHLLPPNNTLQ